MPILPGVADAMLPWLTEKWGNPSNNYSVGREARRAVEEARSSVARLVGARPEQIVFTSGATEANNAVLHSVLVGDRSKRHLVTSTVEHSSVLSYCDYLERYHSFEITRLGVDRNGALNLEELKRAIRKDTAMVSLMWANNETGVIWPVEEIAKICRVKDVKFHTDAVQAVGKLDVSFSDISANFLCVSGHKIGAPKGVGAIVIRDPDSFSPLIHGGKQENGFRGGTESVPFIVGLGKAADLTRQGGLEKWSNIATLRDNFEDQIRQEFIGSEINGLGCERLPNTSSVFLPGIDSDAAVTFLDQHGICASSGSACMQGAIAPSHVILSMSDSYERANETLRVSLTDSTHSYDIERLIKSLIEITSSN